MLTANQITKQIEINTERLSWADSGIRPFIINLIKELETQLEATSKKNLLDS